MAVRDEFIVCLPFGFDLTGLMDLVDFLADFDDFALLAAYT